MLFGLGFLFPEASKVDKEIKRRKNATKERIKAQQKELKDKLPFDAKIIQTLNIGDMLLSKIDDIDYFTCMTDEKSEAIVDSKVQEELSTDYVIKKHQDNGCLYDIKFKEIEI